MVELDGCERAVARSVALHKVCVELLNFFGWVCHIGAGKVGGVNRNEDLHFGHLVLRPAIFSGTRSFAAQEGQTTGMGMRAPSQIVAVLSSAVVRVILSPHSRRGHGRGRGLTLAYTVSGRHNTFAGLA